MNSNKNVTLIVVIVAGVFLAIRAMTGEFGKVYTQTEPVTFTPDVQDRVGESVKPWTTEKPVDRANVYDDQGQLRAGVHLNIQRTLGLWDSAHCASFRS